MAGQRHARLLDDDVHHVVIVPGGRDVQADHLRSVEERLGRHDGVVAQPTLRFHQSCCFELAPGAVDVVHGTRLMTRRDRDELRQVLGQVVPLPPALVHKARTRRVRRRRGLARARQHTILLAEHLDCAREFEQISLEARVLVRAVKGAQFIEHPLRSR